MTLSCSRARSSYSSKGIPADSVTEARLFSALEKLNIKYIPHNPYPNPFGGFPYGKVSDAFIPDLNLWIEVYGGSDPRKNLSIGAKDYYIRMEEKKKFIGEHPEHGSLLIVYSDFIWKYAYEGGLRVWFKDFTSIKGNIFGLPNVDYFKLDKY